MTDKLLIERELLERILNWREGDAGDSGRDELLAILAAPRQPEGEGLEVVGYGFPNTSIFGKPRMMMLAPEIPSDDQYGGAMWEPLVRLSDAQRTIAELRAEISDLHTTMMAAAVEIQEHWQAHCDEEGYGPANLMHRLERGIASQYGYTAQTLVQIEAERDTLRQQRNKMVGLLIEADASFVDGSEAGLELSDLIHAALAEVSK